MSIFLWAREPMGTEIVEISETGLVDDHELCVEAVKDALRRLQPGFYTFVCHDCGSVQDFCISNRDGMRFRPHDGTTKNTTHQRPCLRVIVSRNPIRSDC